MTTYCVKARGSAWGSAYLHDGWGEATDEEVAGLTSECVARFDREMDARKNGCFWLPGVSEVHGPVDEDTDEDDLEAIRDEAIGSVWNDWCEGELTFPADTA